MTQMFWRDSHLSGKFEADLDQWKHAVVGEMIHEHAVDVFACTEAGEVKRLPLPKGWGQFSPSTMPGADGLIAWDGDVFRQRALARGVESVTTVDFGARKGVGLHWVLLRHLDTEGTLLRMASHWPAHVQQGANLSKGGDRQTRSSVRAWTLTEKHIGDVVADLIDQHDPDAVVGSFDFNVDLLRHGWAKRVHTAFAGTGLHIIPPSEGTLGNRGIDGFATNAVRQRVRPHRKGRKPVRVLPRFPAFDHKGQYVDLVASVQ